MNFLLEIGTEEIPHWMIPGALEQLKSWASDELPGATISTDATPRRLVIQASDVPKMQMRQEEIVWGPAKSAPPAALQGFAKKNGVAVDELKVRSKDKGEYFSFVKVTEGLAYSQILALHLPGAILAIQWPKTMYWTRAKNVTFIRPIRWIVALLGDEVIPFEIAGVKTSNITRGHRQLGSSNIPVSIETYEPELRRNHVILSSHERRHKIETEASKLGAKIDTDLLETLTFITEYPTAIKGAFDPAFLELPSEVLTTVMRHHQKYFSVEGPQNLLEPNFIAVMNTLGDPEGLVKHGNERVLKARFNDARFFWNVDQVKKLEDRVEDLEKVTFQAKLGSYLEKTKRVVELVKELGANPHAQRAALLCKTDLTTEMVKEFTELQGVVGGLYARHQGEPEPVWKAIYEHYQPVSMEDSIPETKEGQLVSLADRLDTLRECFRIGMVPTGSKDPFALRRAAQGVVKILAEAKLDYRIDALVSGQLHAFLLERIQHYFREVCGFKYDEVNAVLASGCGTLADVQARLQAMAQVRPSDNFEPLAANFKRIRNILAQANYTGGSAVQEHLLEPGPERDLYSGFIDTHMRAVERQPDYVIALENIAKLRPLVDNFFDHVLVNSTDQAVRINRLAFLHQMFTAVSRIADLSEIVTSGDQK